MFKHTLTASFAAVALLLAHPTLAADAQQMEENKKAVAAFYDAALKPLGYKCVAEGSSSEHAYSR